MGDYIQIGLKCPDWQAKVVWECELKNIDTVSEGLIEFLE